MNNINLGTSQSRGYENANLELIKVTTNEQGQKLVSARELYLGLGLDKSQWSRWSKKNIEQNDFFKENVDWVGFDIVSSGNNTKDFAISLDFAKHIAMMARTEKSHEYRNYFIECEKVAQNPYANLSPELQSIIMLDQKQLVLEQNQMKLNQRMTEFEENASLDPGEYNLVCSRVSSKVNVILKERGINREQIGELYKALNRDIKEITGVKTRTQLRKRHLDMVLDFINDWQPSRATMITINQMSLGI